MRFNRWCLLYDEKTNKNLENCRNYFRYSVSGTDFFCRKSRLSSAPSAVILMEKQYSYLVLAFGINLIGGTILFLMLHVFLAQILADVSIDFSAITILGFALHEITAFLIAEFVPDKIQKHAYYRAGMLALLFNITMWVCLTYFGIFREYPEVWFYPNATGFSYYLARGLAFVYSIPQIFQTFSIYVIGSIPIFWEWALITFIFFQLGFYLALTGGQ